MTIGNIFFINKIENKTTSRKTSDFERRRIQIEFYYLFFFKWLANEEDIENFVHEYISFYISVVFFYFKKKKNEFNDFIIILSIWFLYGIFDCKKKNVYLGHKTASFVDSCFLFSHIEGRDLRYMNRTYRNHWKLFTISNSYKWATEIQVWPRDRKYFILWSVQFYQIVHPKQLVCYK